MNFIFGMPVRMQCTFLFLLPSCHAGTKCFLPLASAGREGYTGLMYGMFLPSFSHGYEPQTVPAHRTTALLSCHTRFHVEDGRVSAKCQSQSRDANDLFLSYCMRLMTIVCLSSRRSQGRARDSTSPYLANCAAHLPTADGAIAANCKETCLL